MNIAKNQTLERIVGLALLGICVFVCQSIETRAEEREVSGVAVAQQAFQLTPSSPTGHRSILVDATATMTISLTATSQSLRIGFVSPSGITYMVGDPPTANYESSIFPIDAPVTTPGASYVGNFTNPEVGIWFVDVSQASSPTSLIDVVCLAMFNNSTRLVLVGGGDTYPLATDIRIALVAFDGISKVHNLRIDATVFRPNDPTFSPILQVFRDDGVGADEVAGDGIYEGFVNPGQAGKYQVQVNAQGTASTGSFVRTAAAEFNVVPRKATIQSFTDRGIDNNSDGLTDLIGVSPRATLVEGGDYLVSVRLEGTNGREVMKSTEEALAAGFVSVEVQFSTSDIIRDIGVDGPYQVREVKFLQLSGGDLVPADIRYDMGATAAYSMQNFQRPRIRLTGLGSASGVDTNFNGLFDKLTVDVELSSDFGGFYNFSASLIDFSGKELGFKAGSKVFNSGTNTIGLDFPGLAIGQNGVDGPYFVSNLIVFGAGQSLVSNRAFTTQAFAASQFEGYQARNHSPVADAGPDEQLECTGDREATAALDGSKSADADSTPGTNDDIVSLVWSEGGTSLASGVHASVPFRLGSHGVTLTVTDKAGATGTDDVNITVQDTTAPVITCPANVQVECQSAGQASVLISPAIAADSCYGTGAVANDRTSGGADASGSYPLGSTKITFTATDGSGNTSSCQTTITVVDTTPPVIQSNVSPSLLWPPNHRMMDVAAEVTATDACSGATGFLSSVVSTEPDDAEGSGDGNTVNDIQGVEVGTADYAFQIRAERDGNGEGRIYEIAYGAVDGSGNRADAVSFIRVPHDQGGGTEPILLSTLDSQSGTVLTWGAVPGASSYRVVRGGAGNLREAGDYIDLGTISCIQANSSGTTTKGNEDAEIPPLGEAFFYLVAYSDGRDSGYGSDTATKPRVKTGGGCE